MSDLRKLAQFIHDITWDQLPERVRETAALRVLDLVSVAAGAAKDPLVAAVKQALGAVSGCTVVMPHDNAGDGLPDANLERRLPDASQADVIVGYRADDSYFSFARAFVNHAISIDQLAEAMRLGELGKQIVLASPQAFAALRFQGCEIARASTYHGLRNERDRTAREAYRRKSAEADLDGLFMRDIIREKVTNDDPRL